MRCCRGRDRWARAGGRALAPSTSRVRTDDGYASVLVLSLTAVVVLLASVLVALGSVATARHRAASAADLAALAAAGHAGQGTGAACARAAEVVAAVQADLVSCTVGDGTARTQVQVRPGGPLGALGVARSRARAGPAGSGP